MNNLSNKKLNIENQVIDTLKSIAETGVYTNADAGIIMEFVRPMCEKIYKKYKGDYRICNDYTEEALVDDAAIKAPEIAGKYDSNKGNFNSYLYKSIENVMKDNYKKYGHHPEILSLDEMGNEDVTFIDVIQADESYEPGRDYEEQALKEDLIKRASEIASPLEISVLELKVEGLSNPEIAEKLGKTTEQVTKALSKCRKKLDEHRDMLL